MHQKSSLTDPVASDQARIIEGLDQIVDLPGDFHRFSAISIRGVFLCRQRRRLGGSVEEKRQRNNDGNRNNYSRLPRDTTELSD